MYDQLVERPLMLVGSLGVANDKRAVYSSEDAVTPAYLWVGWLFLCLLGA